MSIYKLLSLYSDLVFLSNSKLQCKNSNSYFNLLLLLLGDIILNPGPLHKIVSCHPFYWERGKWIFKKMLLGEISNFALCLMSDEKSLRDSFAWGT